MLWERTALFKKNAMQSIGFLDKLLEKTGQQSKSVAQLSSYNNVGYQTHWNFPISNKEQM